MKSINTILKKLTFDDLHDWAGETILNRGKGYVKRIDPLSRIEDNTLAAWVTGGERYATSVRIDDAGDFEHFCSCPYSWGPCKHPVAVILAAVEYVKRKETIPLLAENNDLQKALYGGTKEDEWLDDEWEDDGSVDNTTSRPSGDSSEYSIPYRKRNSLTDLSVRKPAKRRCL